MQEQCPANMAAALPSIPCCPPLCDDPQTVSVPGPAGESGQDGTNGTDGVSVFTTFTAIFTMPAADGASSAVATVGDTSWMVIGQKLYGSRVDGSVHAFLQVVAIGGATSVTLLNLENTATSAYLDNSDPGLTLSIGSVLMPAGIQGPAGVIGASSAVGGDLKGTYPNLVFLNKPNALGDIIVGNGTDAQAVSKGANGTILGAIAAAPGVGYQALIPITGGTNVDTNRVVRLSASTGLPIPLVASRFSIKDPGGAGTVVADAETTVGNARGADAIDLQTSRNAITQVASGTESVLGGGRRNTAAATQSTIAGGDTNSILAGAQESFIGGGMSNLIQALGERAVIGGGDTNVISGPESVIAGGNLNVVAATQSAIVGGDANNIAAACTESFIGGGNGNLITVNGAAVIAGGASNAVSGTYGAIGGGTLNQATGVGSCVPGGIGAVADKYGQLSHSGGSFAAAGDAQAMEFVLRRATMDATASELFLDGASARMTIPINTTWVFHILTTARDSNGATAESAAWEVKGVISNDNGATTLVAAVTSVTLADDTGGTWVHAVTADNGSDSLIITVTGEAARNVRWCSHVRAVQVTYP